MRRTSLWVALTVAACGAREQQTTRIELPGAVRQAQVLGRVDSATAVLHLIKSGQDVFVSDAAPVDDNGAVLTFHDVPPDVYEVRVAVTASAGGSDFSLLDYVQHNVSLVAGDNGVQPAGAWEAPAEADADLDGDGVSNLAEVLGGMAPADLWAKVADIGGGSAPGVSGADQRSLLVPLAGELGVISGLERVEVADFTTLDAVLKADPSVVQAPTPSVNATYCPGSGTSLLGAALRTTNSSTPVHRVFARYGERCVRNYDVALNGTLSTSALQEVRNVYAHTTNAGYEGGLAYAWDRAMVAPVASSTFFLGLRSVNGLAMARTPLSANVSSVWSVRPTEADSAYIAVNAPQQLFSANGGVQGLVVLPESRCSAAVGTGLVLETNGGSIGVWPMNDDGLAGGSCGVSVDSNFAVEVRALVATPTQGGSADCSIYAVVQGGGTSELRRISFSAPGGSLSCGGPTNLVLSHTSPAPLPLPSTFGLATALHVGSSARITDSNGAPQSAIYVGDDQGHVIGVLEASWIAYPQLPPWNDLGTIPGGGAVTAFVTETRSTDDSATPIPAGLIYSLYAASATALFRSP